MIQVPLKDGGFDLEGILKKLMMIRHWYGYVIQIILQVRILIMRA